MQNHILGKILFLCLIFATLSNAHLYSYFQQQILSKSSPNTGIVFAQRQQWFDQLVDHLDYNNQAKWKQRYYIIDEFFDPKTGPVILYICGESICNGIRDTRSWPAVIAQQTKGLILSLEHRYYGKSYPFEDKSLNLENLKYLNAEQALRDLAYFLKSMTNMKMYGISSSTPWITMGGSYPGALSAWFRYKYPHLTVGSIASSAVILAVQNFHQFDQQIYLSAKKSGDFCVQAIRQLNAYAQNQVSSPNRIVFQTQFKAEKLTARQFLFYWADVIVLKIQYGGRTGFCKSLEGKTLQQKFQVMKQIALQIDPADYGAIYLSNATYAMLDGRGARAWIYQSCTQYSYFQTPSLVHPMRSSLLTIDFYRTWCEDIFGKGIWANVKRVNTQLGGLNIVATNLFMSNGDQDPWQWASLRSSKGTIISQIALCDDCAHCQDFHTPTPHDDKSLTDLRAHQMANIKGWISKHWTKISNSYEI